jgi:hypothetical protein
MTNPPTIGQRVVMAHERDIAMMGTIPEGAVGTVSSIDPQYHDLVIYSVRMDESFEILDEWDNEVCFESDENPGFWWWVRPHDSERPIGPAERVPW